MLECVGVELPLGVVGLALEFAPKICSGSQHTRTGRNPCHLSGRVAESPILVTPGIRDRCCVLLTSSAPLPHLGVELPLGVVSLAAEAYPLCLSYCISASYISCGVQQDELENLLKLLAGINTWRFLIKRFRAESHRTAKSTQLQLEMPALPG